MPRPEPSQASRGASRGLEGSFVQVAPSVEVARPMRQMRHGSKDSQPVYQRVKVPASKSTEPACTWDSQPVVGVSTGLAELRVKASPSLEVARPTFGPTPEGAGPAE